MKELIDRLDAWFDADDKHVAVICVITWTAIMIATWTTILMLHSEQ